MLTRLEVAFMPADGYGRVLPRFFVNRWVRSVEWRLSFYWDVLGVTVRPADNDFAALQIQGIDVMLHASCGAHLRSSSALRKIRAEAAALLNYACLALTPVLWKRPRNVAGQNRALRMAGELRWWGARAGTCGACGCT